MPTFTREAGPKSLAALGRMIAAEPMLPRALNFVLFCGVR
jgi:hypothetical protein